MVGTRRRKQTGNPLLLKRAVSRMSRSRTPMWSNAIGGSTLYDVNEPRSGITVLPSIARDSHLVHIMQNRNRNNRSRRTYRIVPNKSPDRLASGKAPKSTTQSWRRSCSGHSLKRQDRSRASSSGYPSSWNFDVVNKESPSDENVPRDIMNRDTLSYPLKKSQHKSIDTSNQCQLRGSKKHRQKVQEPQLCSAQTQTLPSEKYRRKRPNRIPSSLYHDIKQNLPQSTIVEMDKILCGMREYQELDIAHNSWDSQWSSSEQESIVRQRVHCGGAEAHSSRSSRCAKQTCPNTSKRAKNYGGYTPSETSNEINRRQLFSCEDLKRPSERFNKIEKISLPPSSNGQQKCSKNRTCSPLNNVNDKSELSDVSWRLQLATNAEINKFREKEEGDVCLDVCKGSKNMSATESKELAEMQRRHCSGKSYRNSLYSEKRNVDFQYQRNENGRQRRNGLQDQMEFKDQSCECGCPSCDKTEPHTLQNGTRDARTRQRRNRASKFTMSEDESCDCDCSSCLKTEPQNLRKGTKDNRRQRKSSSPKILKSQNQSEDEDQSCECDCPDCKKSKSRSRKQGPMDNRRQRRNSSPNAFKSKNQTGDDDQSCECDCPSCDKNDPRTLQKGTNNRQRRNGSPKFKTSQESTDQSCECDCPVCDQDEEGTLQNRRQEEKAMHCCNNCSCPVCVRLKQSGSKRPGMNAGKSRNFNTNRKSYSKFQGMDSSSMEPSCECESSDEETSRKESRNQRDGRTYRRKSSNRRSSAHEYSDDMESEEDSCDCDCPGCINNSRDNEESQINPNCICTCPVCLRLKNQGGRTYQMGTVRKSYSADNPRNSKTSNYPRNSSSGVGGNYANQYCCNYSCGCCQRCGFCGWNRSQNQNQNLSQYHNQNSNNFRGCQCNREQNQRHFGMNTVSTTKEENPMNAKTKKSNSSVQSNCECFEATTQTSQIAVTKTKPKQTMPEICSNEECDRQCDQCQLEEEEASLSIDNTPSECSCSSSDSSSPTKTAPAEEPHLKFANTMSKVRGKTAALQTRNKEIQCSCKCPHCGVNLDDVSKNSTEKKSPNKAQTTNSIPRQPISKRQTTVTKELPKNTNPTKGEYKIKPLNAKAKTAKEEAKTLTITAKKGTRSRANKTRDDSRNKALSSREDTQTKAENARKELEVKADNTQIKQEESQTKFEPSRKEVKSEKVEAEADNQEISSSKTPSVPKKEPKKTSTEDSTDVSSGSKTANSKRNAEMPSKTSALQDELDRCKAKLIDYCNNQTCPKKNSDPTAGLGKAMPNIDLNETCNVNQILEILHETVAGLEQQKKLLSQAAAGSGNQRPPEVNSPHGESPQGCMNFCEQQQQQQHRRRSHGCVKPCPYASCYRQFHCKTLQNPPKNFGYLQAVNHCTAPGENDEKPVVRLHTDRNSSYPAEPDASEEHTDSCPNHCFWLNRDRHRKRSGSSYPFENSPRYSPSFTYSEIKRKTLQKCRPTKSFFQLFDMALMMKKNRRCLRQRNRQRWPQKSLIKSREHYEYLVDKNPKYLDMPNRANSYERNILKGIEQQTAICEIFETKPCRKECQENLRNRKGEMDKEDAGRRPQNYTTFEHRKYKVSRPQREQSEQTELSGKHSNGYRDSSDCRLAFRGKRDQRTKAAQKKTDYYDRGRQPPVMIYSSEGWLDNSSAQSPVRTDNTKNKSKRGNCYCTGENTNIISEELQTKGRCPKEEKKTISGKNSYPWKKAGTPQDLDLKTWEEYLQTACDNTNCEKLNGKQSSSSDCVCYNRNREKPTQKCKNANPKPEDTRNLMSQKSSSEKIEKSKNYEVCQRSQKPTKNAPNLFSCCQKKGNLSSYEELVTEGKPKQKSSKCFSRKQVENPDRLKEPEAEKLEVEPKRKKSLNLFPCCNRTPKEKKEKVKELEPKAAEEEKEPKKRKSGNLFACCNRSHKEKKEKVKEPEPKTSVELEKVPKPKKSLSLFSCANKTPKEKQVNVQEPEPEKVTLEKEPKSRKSSNLFSCCHKTHKEKQEKVKEPEPEEPEKEPKQKKSLNLFSCCNKTHKEKKEKVKEPVVKESPEIEKESKPRQKSPYIFPCFQKSHKEKKEKPKEEEDSKGETKSTGCFPCVWQPTRDKTETSDYNESEYFESKVYHCVPEAVTVENCCECDDDEVKILYDSSYKFLKNNKEVTDTDCECDEEKTDLSCDCSNNFYSMLQ